MNNLQLTDLKQKQSEFGTKMFQLIKILYPICRSITGNGVRETLRIIQQHIPLKLYEIPTNTQCFDWKIPKEWNINDAYIIDPNGKKIVDFKNSNLHVVNYSIPIHKKIQFSELKTHLHYISDKPNSIPYRTSYYNENWGFCITYNQFKNMSDGEYEVCIDSTLTQGNLTYGELFIPGKLKDEILFSCYVCHPSLCNDNLSGISLITMLAKILSKIETKFSYRFLFIPETIGAIAWISKNEKKLNNIKCGMVATCCGDNGISTYKKTRDGDSLIDKIVENVLINSKKPYRILDFWPSGSDERQFSSPGFNLPVGSLMKTVYDNFEQYHTSDDNLDLMDCDSLGDSLIKYLNIIFSLENHNANFPKKLISKKFKTSTTDNPVFLNQNPKCEPQLGKRDLYEKLGALTHQNIFETKNAIQWILNFSDGHHSLFDISIKSKISTKTLHDTSKLLEDVKLIKKI